MSNTSKIIEQYSILINDTEKLIKEYDESIFNDGETPYQIEDYIAGLEMLAEAMELLKQLTDYKIEKI